MADAKPPFSEDQVSSLNAYQQSKYVHPFTCGSGNRMDEHHKDGGSLVATTAGWICPGCDYTQGWAHEWMANWEWKVMEQARGF